MSLCILITLFLLRSTRLSYAEVFTAVSDLRSLLDTQKKIINNIDGFVVSQEEKLLGLKNLLATFKKEYDIAVKDELSYVENPINAFKLIKSLTIDITRIKNDFQTSIGDLLAGLEWTKTLSKVNSKYEKALSNIFIVKHEIMERQKRGCKKYTALLTAEESIEATNDGKLNQDFYAVCRGELDIAPEIAKMLKCRYLTENHPFLKIAPFKLEQVYINPDVYVYHDVLNDEEIEAIKTKAKPKLRRALVRSYTRGNGSVASNDRIGKLAWFKDGDSEVVARLSLRVRDMTNLDLTFSEQLQILNYGIGGHYVPHNDFTLKERRKHLTFKHGQRLATVLFYMSDVAQGGATVFPKLGLRVSPVKKTAVLWYNLHPSGEGNTATMHGSCPVLQGSKWILTKWIFQHGQELIKPCNLVYQPEGIVGHIPKPVKM